MQYLNEKGSSESKDAFSYLRDVRDFSEKSIKEFRLGYMPSFVQNINKRKHEFAGRIIIPIFDHYDHLVAISSRDWRKEAKQKFWHEAYSKSLFLFGLNIAKKNIINYSKSIIVEGEFDVISLHSKGISISVGALGSSLGLYQLSLLMRYASDIYLLFDGDESGQKAIKRTLKIVEQNALNGYDLNIIPTFLPDQKDPDEFIREKGQPEIIRILNQAKKQLTQRKFKEL